MGKKASPVKLCLKCKKVLPLTEFYSNRAWEEQNGVDIYCKECANKMCVDKESMRKYMWENNRVWDESIWEFGEKRAMTILANNKEWLTRSTPIKRKEELKYTTICHYCFVAMNYNHLYHFEDHYNGEDGDMSVFNPDSLNGTIVRTADGETVYDEGCKIYSPVWNSFYTQREIDYLDNYYRRLQSDFVLDDVNIQDYARKICKASLECDSRYDSMRAGKCTSKEWQQAQDIFDSLCKSAAFAACQKKDKSTGGDGILCELIQYIETNHYADMPKVEFEMDDVDQLLNDFKHTEVAIS